MYYQQVAIETRLPKEGKYVTTIDESGEHRVCRRFGGGWNMRDINGDNSPPDNIKLIYWLEEVDLRDEIAKSKQYDYLDRQLKLFYKNNEEDPDLEAIGNMTVSVFGY